MWHVCGINTVQGTSPRWRELWQTLQQLSEHPELNILFLGETGTGKDHLAQCLHLFSRRGKFRPFVAVQLNALPESLAPAELFGITRGAFTDAREAKAGRFQLAHRGDLLLDEVFEASLHLQAQLLRAIQEKSVTRLGATKAEPAECRILATTNLKVEQLSENDRVRFDLLQRLSEVLILVPALRDRQEDIPALAQFAATSIPNGKETVFSRQAMQQLCDYAWPGNTRELFATVRRTVALNPGGRIQSIQWSALQRQPQNPLPEAQPIEGNYDAQVQRFSRELMRRTMNQTNHNALQARKALGLTQSRFYRLWKEASELSFRTTTDFQVIKKKAHHTGEKAP